MKKRVLTGMGCLFLFTTFLVAQQQREIKTDMGLSMQPNEKIQWMTNDKLGMFIHWGLYAGPARGEWHMENAGIPISTYRKLAYPQSNEQYFDASQFDADA